MIALLLLLLSSPAQATDCTTLAAAIKLQPERFTPGNCARMVEAHKDFILNQIAKGNKVRCELVDGEPMVYYESKHGGGSLGCPYAFFKGEEQKCKAVQGKNPKWWKPE